MKAASFCGRACEAVKDIADSLAAANIFVWEKDFKPPARPNY
jgi:hypothetical protein